MTKLNRQVIRHYVEVWQEMNLSERQAEAISVEVESYQRMTSYVLEKLAFDDEPSDFVLALSGRQSWRG
jgi:hypothetical protein